MTVRLAVLAAALLCTTACREFEGDLGALGFVSNLRIGAGHWTPDHPIAAGTRAVFVASEVIGEERDEVPAVTGRIEGSLDAEVVDDAQLAVWGRGRGVVWFEGEATDRFGVEFVPAVGASLADPGEDGGIAEADFALAPGADVALAAVLVDRRGRQLGYAADDLDVAASGPVSAWVEDGIVRVTADGDAGADGTIAILHRDKRLGRVPVAIASPEEVVDVELVTQSTAVDGGAVVVVTAVAWLDDDTRLLGVAPEWSWTGHGETERPDQLVVFVPTGGRVDVEARVGGRAASVR